MKSCRIFLVLPCFFFAVIVPGRDIQRRTRGSASRRRRSGSVLSLLIHRRLGKRVGGSVYWRIGIVVALLLCLATATSSLRVRKLLTQIPKFGFVLVVVLRPRWASPRTAEDATTRTETDSGEVIQQIDNSVRIGERSQSRPVTARRSPAQSN